MKKTVLVSLLAALVSSVPVSAQEYILPVEAFSSSSFIAGWEDRTIRNFANDKWTTNGSNLTVNKTAAREAWVSAAGDLGGDGEAWISYDLGGQYNLTGINLMNGGTNTARNIQGFDVQVSNDNVTWSNVLTGQTLNQATTSSSANQSFAISATDVRYARVRVTSNYGDANYVNLSNALFQGTAAGGQSFVDMTTVTASTSMGSFSGAFDISNIVGNVGIRVPSDPAGSLANDAAGSQWVSQPGSSGTIDLLLAENIDIQSIIIWNGNDGVGTNADRGVQQFDILVSSTTSGDDFVATTITNSVLGFTSLGGGREVPGENFLLEEDNVRRIRINIDSNYGDAYTMLNGVQIIAVPEPSTYALLAGVGALVLVMIRRRMR